MSKKDKETKDTVPPTDSAPETPPDPTEPAPPEQPETDLAAENEALKEAIKGYEAKIAGLEAQTREAVVEESPDPDYHIFFHKRFAGDRVTLPNGHVVEFKNRYAKIKRDNPTDYALIKSHALCGIEWDEVNRMIVQPGIGVSTGPVSTATAKETTR